MNDLKIRMAVLEDAEQLVKIYAPFVTDTAISFEYEVPSVEEFRNRIKNKLEKFPFLVAEMNGEAVGYVYASTFIPRPAYDWSVEITVYIKEECTGEGIGRKLYDAIEELLIKQNIYNINACIAYTEHEDPYLTNRSMDFHEHMGYRLVGKFTKSGYKFGRWYDMIWMEKILKDHPDHPENVLHPEYLAKSSL